jgi:hypothetical protein
MTNPTSFPADLTVDKLHLFPYSESLRPSVLRVVVNDFHMDLTPNWVDKIEAKCASFERKYGPLTLGQAIALAAEAALDNDPGLAFRAAMWVFLQNSKEKGALTVNRLKEVIADDGRAILVLKASNLTGIHWSQQLISSRLWPKEISTAVH